MQKAHVSKKWEKVAKKHGTLSPNLVENITWLRKTRAPSQWNKKGGHAGVISTPPQHPSQYPSLHPLRTPLKLPRTPHSTPLNTLLSTLVM